MNEPLLDLRVYKYPMFALASVIAIVNAVAMFSGMILTPAYVQNVRGISPLNSGLMMLPGAVIMGVMSPITGKLFDKYGPRILGIVGLSITAVSTYMLANLQIDSSHTHIILIYTLRMFGMAMVMMPLMTNGLNQLPTRLNPHGTAVNNTAQQVSGSIGTAILVTIMNSVTTTKAESLMSDVASNNLHSSYEGNSNSEGFIVRNSAFILCSAWHECCCTAISFFVKRVDTSAEAVDRLNR